MLRLDEVIAGYGDVEVLHGVGLEIAAGETLALVGANGAGKTTLLNCISGIVPARQGSIEFKNERIDQWAAESVVEAGLVMVPEGRALFPFMTVQENLELGSFSRRARGSRARSQDFVFSLLPVLAERRHQLAGSLSGGEQQMCAIARGIMARPELLMLDEPSLGLAPRIVQEVFNLIETLKQEGIAVLLVEQHVKHALGISDRGCVLENGRIVLSNTSSSLMTDSNLRRAYMGHT